MKTRLLRNFLFIAFATLMFLSCAKKEEPAPVEPIIELKHRILVLDTSLSMVGKGGSNIMPQVKESLYRFVDKFNVGDSFTFATFDTEVKFYPTIVIADESDKEVVKKYISIVEAKGQWTYTMLMFADVLAKADELGRSDTSKKIEIVVLTDALDDPPPSAKKKSLDIKALSKGYSTEDWFIYLVSLTDLKNSEQMKEIVGALPGAQVLQGAEDPNAALENISNQNSTIEQPKKESPLAKLWGFILVPFLLLVIIAIVYFKHISDIKLFGYLDYKNYSILGAKYEAINLQRFSSRSITIGRDSLCELRIPDFELNRPVVLEAKSIKGSIQIIVNSERGSKVEYLENKNDQFLSNGTRFRVGGYDFVYRVNSDV